MFLFSEIMGAISVAMLIWAAVGVHKNIKKAKALERQRCEIVGYHKTAEDLLQRARHLSTMAALDQPFAVCDSCNRIHTRYVRDENGVTCIECAEKHTERD